MNGKPVRLGAVHLLRTWISSRLRARPLMRVGSAFRAWGKAPSDESGAWRPPRGGKPLQGLGKPLRQGQNPYEQAEGKPHGREQTAPYECPRVYEALLSYAAGWLGVQRGAAPSGPQIHVVNLVG